MIFWIIINFCFIWKTLIFDLPSFFYYRLGCIQPKNALRKLVSIHTHIHMRPLSYVWCMTLYFCLDPLCYDLIFPLTIFFFIFILIGNTEYMVIDQIFLFNNLFDFPLFYYLLGLVTRNFNLKRTFGAILEFRTT